MGAGSIARNVSQGVTGTDCDPTKDPEFQKVVRHFLTTAPKPHKPAGTKNKSPKTGSKPKARPKA
jgi:hypothetical protein